jgi:chromosome segregation ATPase
MSTEERLTELERSFVTLTHLLESASERADTHDGWINQLGKAQAELSHAQAETETKIAALVDAQVRTEDVVARLGRAVTQLVESQTRTDAQIAQLTGRVDKLTDTLERYFSSGRNEQE